MPEQSIRFGVGSEQPPRRGASWKIWTPSNKFDVYIASRDIGGALKLSLHESGQWHLAYNEAFFDEKIPKHHRDDRGRFIDTWKRPEPIAPGLTLAVRVVTPWSAMSEVASVSNKLTLIEPPIEGRAVAVGIFVVESTVQVSGWPGKNGMGTNNVGSYDMPDGSKIWAVSWDIECPDFSQIPKAQANLFSGVSKSDISSDLRALIFGDNDDGSKTLYDLRGRYERSDA
jgi:hypothetical protein